MSGLLLQIGATKLVVSVVLAGITWIVHRRVGRPAVSHTLWLLVLVTLLVPAVVSLPVLPAQPDVVIGMSATGSAEVVLAEGTFDSARGARFGTIAGPGVAIAWLLGTMGLLTWSLLQTVRFQRRLTSASRPAPRHLQREAAAIGHDLGLVRIPEVLTTGAHITPMVWWIGGRVRVLVPSFLLTELSRDELHAILAHELAHVRRRDHLVRWLEWLACAVFWWKPVAWWGRHQLRIAEESCCDRLALDAGRSSPGTYANALLRVVANASQSSGFPPPLPATAAGGVGSSQVLERRLRMIISTDTRSPAPRLRAFTWGAVLCVLPFGLIYCDRATTPVADEEEAAPEAKTLENPGETFAGDLTDILTRREEDIHRSIQEKVESGALDEYRGGLLSAYVSGAKAGLLIHYEGRDLSDEEKQAVADRLTASAARVNLAPGAAMVNATVFRELLMHQLVTEILARDAEFIRNFRKVQLLRVPRPPLPLIVREKPPSSNPDPREAAGSSSGPQEAAATLMTEP